VKFPKVSKNRKMRWRSNQVQHLQLGMIGNPVAHNNRSKPRKLLGVSHHRRNRGIYAQAMCGTLNLIRM